MPTMSAPSSRAFALMSAAASRALANARASGATGPSKRGYCSSRISRRYSSTASISIERPPTRAYHSSQENAGSGTHGLRSHEQAIRRPAERHHDDAQRGLERATGRQHREDDQDADEEEPGRGAAGLARGAAQPHQPDHDEP